MFIPVSASILHLLYIRLFLFSIFVSETISFLVRLALRPSISLTPSITKQYVILNPDDYRLQATARVSPAALIVVSRLELIKIL